MSPTGWVGIDLDQTLAFYDSWHGPDHIGPPITAMIDRVKTMIELGTDVRILTARVYRDGSVGGDLSAAVSTMAISEWCERYLGKRLPITCTKDYDLYRVYDDRSIQIEANTGRIIEDKPFIVHYVIERDSDTGHDTYFLSEVDSSHHTRDAAQVRVGELRTRSIFAGITEVK